MPLCCPALVPVRLIKCILYKIAFGALKAVL